MSRKIKTERLSLSGMLLAIGILLPYATAHGIGIPGTVLLPMHIPVLICGMLCGPLYGTFVGLALPILNSILTSMPAFYPMMPIMACELAIYGFTSGIFLHKTKLKNRRIGIYVALLLSMICGRIGYGLAYYVLLMLNSGMKAPAVFTAVAVGIPGIIVQFLLVPGVVLAVRRFMNKENGNAMESAKNLISKGKATCVVIKDGRIINIESGRGVKPIIAMYEQGILENAVVVDKIIGKAAAMIVTLGGVKHCYGLTMSEGAIEFFEQNNISFEYETRTEYIINRKGDGICPMEETVKNIDSPKEAVVALKAKIQELSNN